jgi:hypothetical protein
MGSELYKPIVHGGTIVRDESASIVMIAGANCDGDNVGELLDEGLDFTRLFPFWFRT